MEELKKKVEEIVARLKSDPKSLKDFGSDPVKTIENLSGIDIPDGMEDKIVAGVKAALAGEKAGGIIDAIKNLF